MVLPFWKKSLTVGLLEYQKSWKCVCVFNLPSVAGTTLSFFKLFCFCPWYLHLSLFSSIFYGYFSFFFSRYLFLILSLNQSHSPEFPVSMSFLLSLKLITLQILHIHWWLCNQNLNPCFHPSVSEQWLYLQVYESNTEFFPPLLHPPQTCCFRYWEPHCEWHHNQPTH